MKYLLIIIAIFASHSCAAQVKTDTTYKVPARTSGLSSNTKRLTDNWVKLSDSLSLYKKKSDSFYYVIWARNYRLTRIKHYWVLYRKDPKYLKFLNSWISRALH